VNGVEPRIRVRPATSADAGTIVRFVRALAEFEREPAESVRLTEADVLRDGFGERPRFEVLIGEVDGEPAGFALFFPNYSTWEGRAGIYIEDLFVDERARGTGLGRALMAAAARLAVERGAARLELSVLDWNPAREFYERLGMWQMREWLPYRVDGEQIARLASEAAGDEAGGSG
jgi:GNAT superfamily N-acetyltransferase